ncbi:hypothetical protein AB0903_12320 [Streptomyces sp. NPDC048389]|uniref:hypothetical protein n=1 Tax=Streptomyces sp. NPDC048389 TaxID=3154622 RepID=UPI0034536477
MTDARSPMRALRAALFAAVAVTLAATGHSSLSAHHIPAAALVAALGATAVAGWLAAGRRRGARSIGAGLLAVQGVLHMIFAGGGQAAAHHHGPHQPSPDAAVGIGMLAVHLAAAVGCALWLAHGETAFFRLARTAFAFTFTPLRLLLGVVRLPEAVPVPRPVPRPRRLHGAFLTHTVVRRGPPAPCVPRATAPGAAV